MIPFRPNMNALFTILLLGCGTICVGCASRTSMTARPSLTAIAVPVQGATAAATITATATAQATVNPVARFTTTTPSEPPGTMTASPTLVSMQEETLGTTNLGEIIYIRDCDSFLRIDGADGANQAALYVDGLCKNGPELSPTGQWISYIASKRDQVQALSLWVLDVKGKDAWQISNQVPSMDRGWLASGKLLYTEYPSYVFDPQGDEPPDYGLDYRTFVYDPVDKTQTEIPPLPFSADYYRFAFSPVEDKIAAVREETKDLFVANLDGSEAVTLVRDYPLTNFVWSPSGKHLAYSSWGYREEVYVVDAADGQIRKLTHKDERRDIAVRSWSPDGKWIAFDEDAQVCVVGIKDGEELCFGLRAPGTAGFPVPWSPDSSMVAITERIPAGASSSQWDIYSVHVTDGEVNRLTRDSALEMFLLWQR